MSDPIEPGTVRVVIADDHFIVRTGLRMVLEPEPGFAVVGEAWDVPSTLRCLRDYRPDVLLLDLYMPGASSIAAIPRIAREFPDVAIVVLATGRTPVQMREALRRGARGYVLKAAADTDLLDAVRDALDDEEEDDPDDDGDAMTTGRLLSFAHEASAAPAVRPRRDQGARA